MAAPIKPIPGRPGTVLPTAAGPRPAAPAITPPVAAPLPAPPVRATAPAPTPRPMNPGAPAGPALARGPMAGYNGPRPGTPEFKAARAAGQTPIRDYLQAQRGNRMPGPMGPRPAGNTGIVPPHLRTPTGPRPMLSEGGKVKKGAAKAPPPPKKPPPKKSGRR